MSHKSKNDHHDHAYLRALDLWADTEHRLLRWLGYGFLVLALVALILRPFAYDGGTTGLWDSFFTNDPILLFLNLGLPFILVVLGGYVLWRPAQYEVRRNYVERLASANPTLFMGLGFIQVVVGLWIGVTALTGSGLNLPNMTLMVAFAGLGAFQVWRSLQIRHVQQA